MNKAIIVTTEYRGVFYAEVPFDKDLTTSTLTDLKNCKMAIYWGTEKGLMEMAKTGPTSSSKISAPADIQVLHKVTAIFDVTDEAREKWMSA